MSTSKHINLICIIVTVLTVAVTVLFMNGETLGITVITDEEAGDSLFTSNDLNGDWDSSNATRITLNGDGGSVSGNGAYIYNGDVYIVYAGKYVISGELTDGSIIINADGDDKIWLLLDGVHLSCENNAAIIVEQAEKVFLTLAEGTENVISCGAEYSEDAVLAGIDGAIYSRDDLTINGSGSLTVTAEYKHGIVCNDDLVITGGAIDVTAAQDGIHANDSVRFANADLTVNAGDDGITVSNDDESAYVYVESGSINILSCYEGIEAIDITIAGGVIYILPTDDGINANGRGGNSVINIIGGDITIINETGRDADGLDSNGSIYISGGSIFISVNAGGGSCALDCGTENGGVCEISGGTVIAAGSSAMAEGFDSSSEQCFIMYSTSGTAEGTAVSLTNEGGKVLLSETIPCSFSSLVISTPELEMGETCTLSIGGTEAEIVVDNSSDSGGFGMGGMQMGSGHGGGFGGGRMFDGNFEDGEIPNGDFADGEMPEMPNGDFADGELPERPDGDFADGELPERPDGDFANGELPEKPDGNFADGELPEKPDGNFAGDEMPNGGFTDNGDFRGDSIELGDNQDAADDSFSLSPETLILTGVSLLVLLAGILFAAKIKH